MGSEYYCLCGYRWVSRKNFGSPARCPGCGGKDIYPYFSPSNRYLLSKKEINRDNSFSHAMSIFNSSEYKSAANETEEQKIERMKKLRALIREKVQKDY